MKKIASAFRRLLEGCSWTGLTTPWILLLLSLYGLGLHSLSRFCGGLAGLMVESGVAAMCVHLCLFLCGLVLLLHETGHRWAHRRLKLPLGLLSAWFIYYGVGAFLWMLLCPALGMDMHRDAMVLNALALLALAAVALGYRNAGKLTTTRYALGEGGATIALISDLHLGDYVGISHLRKIVERVNELNADVVVIAGDLTDEPDEPLFGEEELAKLQSREGVFFVAGNHDPSVENPEFRAFLQRSHIRLLHNEAVQLEQLTLLGHSDPANNARHPSWESVKGLRRPLVAVEHDPRFIAECAERGADLVLCGHTHAGQFFPSDLLVKLSARDRFHYGLRHYGSTAAVISSGAGFFNLPIRLGTENEVVAIHLGANGSLQTEESSLQ